MRKSKKYIISFLATFLAFSVIPEKVEARHLDFLDEIKLLTSKLINEPNLKTVFLKPLYGDASGVRGAALLGRENFI